MAKRLWCVLLVPAFVVLLAPEAFAGKGIVKGVGGGNNGTLYVTDTEGILSDVATGDEILFENPFKTPLFQGDIVSFDIIAGVCGPTATNIRPIAPGTVISDDRSGGLTIDAGRAVIVVGGARISGNVAVNGGVLIVTQGSKLNGNVSITSSNSVIIVSVPDTCR